MTSYVAFLRGINLGQRNKVPMMELRDLFEGQGHKDVATYVQTGNVVFGASGKVAEIARDIERAIKKKFKLEVAVMLRTRRELKQVAGANPFLKKDGAGPTALHVLFLAGRPAASAVRALDVDRSPSDEFAVKGREIFLWYPKGSGRSKLTLGYFEKTLGVKGTARNWNTVTKVLDLMERR